MHTTHKQVAIQWNALFQCIPFFFLILILRSITFQAKVGAIDLELCQCSSIFVCINQTRDLFQSSLAFCYSIDFIFSIPFEIVGA